MTARRSWYVQDDFKPVATLEPLRERVSYVRFVLLACGHSERLTGQRAVTPPKTIACFTCRCARRDLERERPTPESTALAATTEALTRFTKADLAEIAWDLALQTLGGESMEGEHAHSLGNRVLTELVRRRDVVRAATR